MLIIVSTAEPKIVFNSEYCGNSQVLDVFSNYGEFQTTSNVSNLHRGQGGSGSQPAYIRAKTRQFGGYLVSVLHEWCLTISHFFWNEIVIVIDSPEFLGTRLWLWSWLEAHSKSEILVSRVLLSRVLQSQVLSGFWLYRPCQGRITEPWDNTQD